MLLLLLAPLAGTGCGGYYTLTAGDHLAPAGSDAVVVVRLQRNDFFVLEMPIKEAVMRLRIDDGPERAAYTDQLGYAGTTVPAPSEPGRYALHVQHLDREGEEIGAEAAMYAWNPARQIVAVAVDELPQGSSYEAKCARAALANVTDTANIVYLTRKAISKHDRLRQELAATGYLDGPILLWQRKRWHIVRDGRFKMPRVVVEARLVSQLPELRKVFGELSVGIATSKITAEAFVAAGMRAVVVGPAAASLPKASYRVSWADLRDGGI